MSRELAAGGGGVSAQPGGDFVRRCRAGFAEVLQPLLGDAEPWGRNEDSGHNVATVIIDGGGNANFIRT